MKKRYGFRVTSNRPIPITTAGSLAATGWPAAAKDAVKAHIDDLRAKKRNRKRTDHVIIKLWEEGSAAVGGEDQAEADPPLRLPEDGKEQAPPS